MQVPLNWNEAADERTIEIFARIVGKDDGIQRPYLVFLQGGPGNESPRPSLTPHSPSWLKTALERYQVVFYDQRGTGRSTAVNDHLLDHQTPEQVAEYLTHLRADAIVKDCEAIRQKLGVDTWDILGQSFGGFTTIHYLSHYADSLDQCFITGGLTAVDRHCDDIYQTTYEQMRVKSELFYDRFPQDRDKMRRAIDLADQGKIILPTGDKITPSRLRSIGHLLGSNDGMMTLHWLLDYDPLSNAFAHDLYDLLAFKTRNPLYAVIHESSYADGCITNWSADRTMPQSYRDDETLLTGEHVLKEWFTTDSQLRPWGQVADLIAEVEWPKLYDAEALRRSNASGAAAVYAHDAFVPLHYSMETASLIPHVRTWITSEHEHNGLRASNGQVLQHLFDLAESTRLR